MRDLGSQIPRCWDRSAVNEASGWIMIHSES